MLLLFMYWLNVLFKVPNGNNSVLHLRQNQGSSFPLRYWQSIKFRLHLICTHILHLSQYRELSLSPIVLILHGKIIIHIYYIYINIFINTQHIPNIYIYTYTYIHKCTYIHTHHIYTHIYGVLYCFNTTWKN